MITNEWMPLNDWALHLGWMELLVSFIFLVAMMIIVGMLRLRSQNDSKARAWKNREARWDQHLSAVLSGQTERQTLWQLVENHEALFFVDYLYREACRIPVRRLENTRYRELMLLAEPYLKFVARRIHDKKSDPELRARSVATLGKLAPYDSIDILEYALEDSSERVAFTAMRALVDHDDPRCSEIITRVFSRFQGYNPEFVASLLSRSHPESAAPLLMNIVLNPEASLWSRVVAVCTLEHWPQQSEQLPELKALAKDEQQPATLRALILRVLAAWSAFSESRELIYDFASRDEEILRAHAMYAIGRLNLKQEHEILELGLHDPARWVAIEAAMACEHLEKGELVPTRPRWYLQSLDPAL
jgi:HEAT repeat protein